MPRTLYSVPPTPRHLHSSQHKLAFYDLPITAFDKPVDNYPWECGLPVHRAMHVDTAPKKNRAVKTRRCALVRMAHRTAKFVRGLFRNKRDQLKKKKKKKKKTMPSGGIYDEIASLLNRRETPSRNSHYLDEGTRFRLELAGLQVPQRSPALERRRETVFV